MIWSGEVLPVRSSLGAFLPEEVLADGGRGRKGHAGTCSMTAMLEKLLAEARTVKMTALDREEQRRSFAFGNSNIENERITRETIDRAAEELGRR